MKGALYRWVRDLHLYLGLFVSPFLLVFAVTVFFFVHSWVPKLGPDGVSTRSVSGVVLPENLSQLGGRPLVDALKPVLAGLKADGEVGFIRHAVKEERWIIPVSIPGRAITVTLDAGRHEATVETREVGFADALMTLHKSPGQHAPLLRMNSATMRVWRWCADATAYLTLFISVSGLYLWYVLRTERRIGLILLFAGAASFFGLAYVIAG